MANKKFKAMFWPTVIMAALALVFFLLASLQGGDKNIMGLKLAWQMTIQVLPILIFAFIVAGLAQVMLPRDLLTKWVGDESGMRGIAVATLAGALTPGGPYVSLPIVAALLNTGASIAVMITYLTSWSLWAFARLPMEIGILGWKVTLIRLASVIIFPPLAGLLAQFIVKVFKIG